MNASTAPRTLRAWPLEDLSRAIDFALPNSEPLHTRCSKRDLGYALLRASITHLNGGDPRKVGGRDQCIPTRNRALGNLRGGLDVRPGGAPDLNHVHTASP